MHNKFKKIVNKNTIELLLKKQETNMLKKQLIIQQNEINLLKYQLYYMIDIIKRK